MSTFDGASKLAEWANIRSVARDNDDPNMAEEALRQISSVEGVSASDWNTVRQAARERDDPNLAQLAMRKAHEAG